MNECDIIKPTTKKEGRKMFDLIKHRRGTKPIKRTVYRRTEDGFWAKIISLGFKISNEDVISVIYELEQASNPFVMNFNDIAKTISLAISDSEKIGKVSVRLENRMWTVKISLED